VAARHRPLAAPAGLAALIPRAAAPHGWIIDPEVLTVEEYVLAGNVHRVRSITACDQPFRPSVFPGSEFRLSPAALPDAP
jgi:hypothetical protein